MNYILTIGSSLIYTSFSLSFLYIALCSVSVFGSMEIITSLVAEKPVVIFSKSTCCLSHSMTSLIRNFGANPTVHELDEMANGQQIESALLQMGCQPSVPAVFIGKRFIGGSKKIMSLHLSNELIPLLKNAGAIWI